MKQKKRFSGQTGYRLKVSQKIYRAIKVILDFIVALIMTIAFIPLFLIVAIAIKLESRGPVFFCQDRIGLRGKVFKCIKFRSMTQNANPKIAGYKYKEAEAYITKVGAFIRRFSIDELPQLFNVLTFNMSLIGYRPSQKNEDELNVEREKYNMYQIRPGISGWAQVNGRDILASQPKNKAMFDNYYLQKFSLFLDIKIFFLTIVKIFKRDDIVEGIVENQENLQANLNAEDEKDKPKE